MSRADVPRLKPSRHRRRTGRLAKWGASKKDLPPGRAGSSRNQRDPLRLSIGGGLRHFCRIGDEHHANMSVASREHSYKL